MTDRIEADYDQLEALGTRFAQQADQIQRMLQSVRSSMGNLEGGGWVGRGSDSFFSEMNGEVLPASERLRSALDEANRITKQLIKLLKDAEEEAGSPFKARS